MIAISVQDTLQCYAKKVQKVGTKLSVSFIVPESFGPSWRWGRPATFGRVCCCREARWGGTVSALIFLARIASDAFRVKSREPA
jgi:hypothetical protein